ncbi:hypothetical protein HPB48_006535 [Haemaphysalis longicornis]|uniref:Uncharacterized protein n=1 Tax=Haemaphysalis longicornis TaxID=44386 RepID=A0A9J6GIS1_HAELO|nr:hypothetical protein HPB48_006535 [Haemaphysalis longicornis]
MSSGREGEFDEVPSSGNQNSRLVYPASANSTGVASPAPSPQAELPPFPTLLQLRNSRIRTFSSVSRIRGCQENLATFFPVHPQPIASLQPERPDTALVTYLSCTTKSHDGDIERRIHQLLLSCNACMKDLPCVYCETCGLAEFPCINLHLCDCVVWPLYEALYSNALLLSALLRHGAEVRPEDTCRCYEPRRMHPLLMVYDELAGEHCHATRFHSQGAYICLGDTHLGTVLRAGQCVPSRVKEGAEAEKAACNKITLGLQALWAFNKYGRDLVFNSSPESAMAETADPTLKAVLIFVDQVCGILPNVTPDLLEKLLEYLKSAGVRSEADIAKVDECQVAAILGHEDAKKLMDYFKKPDGHDDAEAGEREEPRGVLMAMQQRQERTLNAVTSAMAEMTAMHKGTLDKMTEQMTEQSRMHQETIRAMNEQMQTTARMHGETLQAVQHGMRETQRMNAETLAQVTKSITATLEAQERSMHEYRLELARQKHDNCVILLENYTLPHLRRGQDPSNNFLGFGEMEELAAEVRVALPYITERRMKLLMKYFEENGVHSKGDVSKVEAVDLVNMLGTTDAKKLAAYFHYGRKFLVCWLVVLGDQASNRSS